jgi:hypothetical protein
MVMVLRMVRVKLLLFDIVLVVILARVVVNVHTATSSLTNSTELTGTLDEEGAALYQASVLGAAASLRACPICGSS